MKKKLTLLFIVLYIFLVADISFAQDTITQPDTSRLRIAFAGDIMGHDAQILGAYVDSSKTYNYEPTFRYVKSYLQSVDLAIGNLEVTLGGEPYKGYPQFSSPDNLPLEARNAGFQILITANNHSLDRGAKGFDRTLKMLDSFNIIHTGTFRTKEERDKTYPLIVEKNNIKLALLNYTYGTNGLKIAEPYIVNRIDTAQIRIDLEKAKLAHPDYTIVTIHWGNEYERVQNKNQENLAGFILEHGADAIIGSHPHVIQPIKYYPAVTDSTVIRPVVYSLGNFVSNQRAQYKDGGIIVEMELIKTNTITKFEKLEYLPCWVYRHDDIKSTFYILPPAFYYNNEELFDFTEDDKTKIKRFYTDTKNHLSDIEETDFFEKEKPL